MLSDTAKAALKAALSTRGAHKGRLLAKCPPSHTLAAAAWQGAMLSVNPYKASIAAQLFMTPEQKAVAREVTAWFDALPRGTAAGADRDRFALENLGVW